MKSLGKKVFKNLRITENKNPEFPAVLVQSPLLLLQIFTCVYEFSQSVTNNFLKHYACQQSKSGSYISNILLSL